MKNIKYGYNIYYRKDGFVYGTEPVEEWYKAISVYNWFAGSKNLGTDNFTQVIWKNSTFLGVGIAINKEHETFVVACYNPPGNIAKKFIDNVLPKQEPSITEKVSVIKPRNSISFKEPLAENFTSFQLECLEAHNKCRNIHSVPGLVLNKNLCAYALIQANVSIFCYELLSEPIKKNDNPNRN